MQRTTRLLALIPLTALLTNCSAPFIGSVNVTLGGEAESALLPAAEETESAPECLTYHPVPKSVKSFMAAHNDTDPTIDPWASWLLRLRQTLPEDCGDEAAR